MNELRTFARHSVLLIVAVHIYVAVAYADPPTDPPIMGDDMPAQNIIVIMSDDMESNDLPFWHNEPIRWDPSATNTPRPNDNIWDNPPTWDDHPKMGEAKRRLPDLNKLAARLYANADGALGSYHNPSFKIVPIDLKDKNPGQTETGIYYSNSDSGCTNVDLGGLDGFENGCLKTKDITHDILTNHGGLARMTGSHSVVFSRFYSTSAVCAPARASLLTGRGVKRHDAQKFGSPLSGEEVTVAEFLKQGCNLPSERLCVEWHPDPEVDDPKPAPRINPCGCHVDDDDADYANCADVKNAQCYTTGVIGKWHHGSGNRSAVEQGFDEFIGFDNGVKNYWGTGKLTCSPDTNLECFGGSPAGRSCTLTCGAGIECVDGKCGTNGPSCTDSCASNGGGVCKPRFQHISSTESPKGLYIGDGVAQSLGGDNPSGYIPLCNASPETDWRCCQAAADNTGFYDVGKKTGVGDHGVFEKDTHNHFPCNYDRSSTRSRRRCGSFYCPHRDSFTF